MNTRYHVHIYKNIPVDLLLLRRVHQYKWVHGYGNIIIHNIRDRHVLYGVTKSFSDLNLKNNRKLWKRGEKIQHFRPFYVQTFKVFKRHFSNWKKFKCFFHGCWLVECFWVSNFKRPPYIGTLPRPVKGYIEN